MNGEFGIGIAGLLIVVFAFVAVFAWLIGNYNALVRARNHCSESWSDVDTELRRRYDLIPNLVETVKGYAAHEQSLFEHVAKARSAAMAEHADVRRQAADENELISGMNRLLAVAEAYPDLKASEHFLALQHELANTENRIQRARRFYNANVRELNNRVEMFPSSIIAQSFGFVSASFYEIDDAVVRDVPLVGSGSLGA